ncbi:MAG: C10 family peptidase, partial [Muribaculaceae bacterium]|nr:C10 family peptidase [Muribaculaceae bacterium]
KGLEFEWGNMTLTYSNNSTEVQKMAAATLMQAVGYASEMNYSPSASGAVSYKAMQALIKNFGYGKGIRPIERDYISLSDFEGIMVDELNAGYPIYYAGRTKDAGHAFVCDGYNKEGYFHINWGWGGMSDGYFLTTALGPDAQGIGGADDAFNYSQAIYTNIRPRTPEDGDYSPLLLSSGALTSSAKSVELGGSTRCTLSGYVFNYGLGDCSFSVGMGIFDEKDEMVTVAKGAAHNIRPYVGNGIAAITVQIPSDLKEGTYFIRPVFQLTGTTEWQKISMKVSNPQSILVRVKDNVASFATTTYAILKASN